MSETWYERHVLPRMVDLACGVKPVRRQRAKVVPRARGRVLEVGIGSGLNLPYYDKSRVSAIVGLDPSGAMRRRAERRLAEANLSVEFIGLSAETIPQPGASFDSVLITYTLCSIPDPLAALAEMRRVLKPGGRLIFCEHGLAPDASVRRWQDRLTPLWRRIGGGCHLNRDIPALLEAGGFACSDLQTMYLPGLRPMTYNFWGEAVVRPG
ncbi:MAG: class I SAM-dependent methyltransferase [Burkholderiales bacterium]|nr:class I SAM-dependent methyltransferase [Burkholderiales bacterium]